MKKTRGYTSQLHFTTQILINKMKQIFSICLLALSILMQPIWIYIFSYSNRNYYCVTVWSNICGWNGLYLIYTRGPMEKSRMKWRLSILLRWCVFPLIFHWNWLCFSKLIFVREKAIDAALPNWFFVSISLNLNWFSADHLWFEWRRVDHLNIDFSFQWNLNHRLTTWTTKQLLNSHEKTLKWKSGLLPIETYICLLVRDAFETWDTFSWAENSTSSKV